MRMGSDRWNQILRWLCRHVSVHDCCAFAMQMNQKLTVTICMFHVAPCYQSKRTTVPLCLFSGKNYCHISHIFFPQLILFCKQQTNFWFNKKTSRCSNGPGNSLDKTWQVWEHAPILRWCFCRGAVRWQSVIMSAALLHNERHSLTHTNNTE